MITKRDQDIINFLEDFHIATSNQIHKLFFSNISIRYSRTRLDYLQKEGYIKRTKSTIDNCFAYYINKKPSQIHHDLIRSELYSHIKKQYTVLEWNNEQTIVNIRPDALCFINDHDIVFPVLIEIHLNNKFNFDKYSDLIKNNDIKAIFGIMPKVLICTDREMTIKQNIGLKFKLIDLNMNGLESILK
jgi:hypothetical protein